MFYYLSEPCFTHLQRRKSYLSGRVFDRIHYNCKSMWSGNNKRLYTYAREGNGNPLQHSCLENPVDRGAWWAAVYRVAQSQTWLKQLSMHVCIGEGNGNAPKYSWLENPRDRGAWWAAIYGVPQSWTQLSDFTFTFHFHALEKEMATHSSVLARRIPGTGEPGGLPSMGSHRVGHDWSDLAAETNTTLQINYTSVKF